ncbi:LptF/LptG family permease [Carboxylicivirga sp. A043]|uniref:LptF/LptG family permease n=1 Tax=Carboxylicivirga litoralis TaxID=2816963 RepID=UPI0021CB8DE8|nr:LptF/LptG family permease [Carboxylicivirga sp. A043]MCU4157581.1 LptF/LptG family permease [Carboxylicivirga sp. A043]
MKKLHLFTLRSFVGPLISTFFISLFVLLMQILWQYIDILVGKGLDFITITKLLIYSILQVMPMALPLAILLASLMTFGNMGENYELTAIKASGVSLFKVMKPLIILTFILSIGTFAFSDNVTPWANLKFYSLINSIKTYQPELEIKEKEFNKMGNYSIKAQNKNKTTGALDGLMIYDHSNAKNPHTNTTVAETGFLKMDDNINMMRITLHNGIRYEGNVKDKKHVMTIKDQQYYRVDKFKKQVALIDMQDTEFQVDETGFASLNRMKNLKQLKTDIEQYKHEQQAIALEISKAVYSQGVTISPESASINIESLYYNQPTSWQQIAIQKAKRKTQNQLLNLENKINEISSFRKKEVAHLVEFHRKFTLPFTCLIFFFIGSSLGAIIRKGGFGMPVVMAIVLFIAFYMLDSFGTNMAKKEVLPVFTGMWLSSGVLLLIALFLTYQSSTDSSLLNLDDIKVIIKRKLNLIKA